MIRTILILKLSFKLFSKIDKKLYRNTDSQEKPRRSLVTARKMHKYSITKRFV